MRRTPHISLLLLLLLLGAAALSPRRAEATVSVSTYTLAPLLVGVEVGAGSHLAWEVAGSVAMTPAVYSRAIEGLAQSEEGKDVIHGTLSQALSVQAQLRFFFVEGLGIYLSAGYGYFAVSGQVSAKLAGLEELSQGLEEPDTGSDLPGGGGGAGDPAIPPGAEPGDDGEVKRDVSSKLHALLFGLGYRHVFGNVFLQGELSVVQLLSTSSEPAEVEEYLAETYKENVPPTFEGTSIPIPLPRLAVGVQF